jgi:SAM-dependent methyltransferase
MSKASAETTASPALDPRTYAGGSRGLRLAREPKVAGSQEQRGGVAEKGTRRPRVTCRKRIVNRAESWEPRLRVVHHRYVLPWDHNVYYHRLLLRAVPAGADTVLDVGCGAGQLATKLAVRARRVDALDRDPAMIELARVRAPSNVDCLLADVMVTDLPVGHYDAIVSMSTLHHLPLESALLRLAQALRPGGVLAVVALPRRDLPRELPVELAATTWHHLIGLGLAAGGDRTTLGAAAETQLRP